jgi:bifunctional DNA-binding transcriptional regulator/antitoxin component of YhaV-PrlF toxin-antitoxin module
MGNRFRAKLTSKNQLTLPAGVTAFLGVGAGDFVDFEVDDDGVRVTGPLPSEGAAEWIGYFKKHGKSLGTLERDRLTRELRGERDV